MAAGTKVIVSIEMPEASDREPRQSIQDRAQEAVDIVENGRGSDREKYYWDFLRGLYKYIVGMHRKGVCGEKHMEVLSIIQPTVERYGIISGVIISPELHSAVTAAGDSNR
jgi:hypothetical protein